MSKSQSLKFSVTDFFGNYVSLSETTWDYHILLEHPEMMGYEGNVCQLVQDPYEVRVSTQYEHGVAFISETGIGPGAEGIRVIVFYEDIHFQKGASTGIVATAYPIDLIKYGSPQLGRIIFKKGGRK